jgi:hypothetical protein
MRTQNALRLAVLLVIFLCLRPLAQAQDIQAGAPDAAKAVNAYHLDFVLMELEDGKKINSRQYSMNLNAGDRNSLKVGSRVPVELKQNEVQYLDIGTNIFCHLFERANGLGVEVRAEISNFATGDGDSPRSSNPVIRQMLISGTTVMLPGKAEVIVSVDDPNSKRQFQMEVKATKLR